jgi:hypothetical protein
MPIINGAARINKFALSGNLQAPLISQRNQGLALSGRISFSVNINHSVYYG